MATKTEYYIVDDDEDYAESGISGSEIVGQTFTIGTVGLDIDFVLSSVDVKLTLLGAPTSDVVNAFIYELDLSGLPTGEAISTGSVDIDTFSDAAGGTWGTIPMQSVTLKKATSYVLTLDGNGTVGFWRADGTAPAYAGGNAIWSDDTGATWNVDATSDLMFAINGQDEDGTLCTISDAIFKAGANANATAINPLLVKQFINQAESNVNVSSRKNWIDVYSTLPAHTKYFLNEATSNLAAGYIINYDDSGFSSGLEAQRKIDNLRRISRELIGELKDVEIQGFIETA